MNPEERAWVRDRRAVRWGRTLLWIAFATGLARLLIGPGARDERLAEMAPAFRGVGVALNLGLLVWCHRHPRTGHAAAFWVSAVSLPFILAAMPFLVPGVGGATLVVIGFLLLPLVGLAAWIQARAWNAATRLEEYGRRLAEAEALGRAP